MTEPTDTVERLASLAADNARLRRLLDENGLSDGLRHGLRDTVTMLRAVMRQSAETADDIESYVSHLDGRLSALLRARTVIDAFGEVNLHTLVSDALLFHLVREGEQATISGPCVLLRPKAGQVFALAVHELASNAIEHGNLYGSQGRVEVTWSVAEATSAEPVLTLVWKEVGGPDITPPGRTGFGTAVLEQTLAYELGARTMLAYEPDGLRCTIRFPLKVRIGRLMADVRTESEDYDASL